MKGWGRQCIELEKKYQGKKRLTGSPCSTCCIASPAPPRRATQGSGFALGCSWLAMGMHRGPVPNKIFLWWFIEVGFHTVTLMPNCVFPGQWFLQWETSQLGARVWKAPMLFLVLSEAGLGAGQCLYFTATVPGPPSLCGSGVSRAPECNTRR